MGGRRASVGDPRILKWCWHGSSSLPTNGATAGPTVAFVGIVKNSRAEQDLDPTID